jgi:beta-galactosidase
MEKVDENQVTGTVMDMFDLTGKRLSSSREQNDTGLHSIPLNDAWLFSNDIISYAEQFHFNDSQWRTVDLPHDWSIEDLPHQSPDTVSGPFSRYSIGKGATGWTVGGTGWYRKRMITEKEWQNKLVVIHFDGIYMNSDVWINGYHLGNHPYGYTPFYYDLSPYLKPVGEENVLAVRVRNEGLNSRWYSGSGIYRDVFLSVNELVHIDQWGVCVTTPDVSENSASVEINTTVNNEHTTGSNRIRLITTLISSKGKEVGRAQTDLLLEANRKKVCQQTITVSAPELWDTENPVMYKAVSEIKEGAKIIESVETPFGIRSIKFDGEKGFLLNGKVVKLRGGCLHHDNGPLGAVSIYKAEERKLGIMKKNGYNAVRSSHNPASQALLNACDRLGMLVIDEAFDTWVRAKNPQDYHLYFNEWWQKDLEAMILSARNHPSVIMWSIGNEIYEAPDPLGHELAGKLANKIRHTDPTRPVTGAIVYLPPFTKSPWENYEPYVAHLDVDGYNYFLETKSNFFLRDSLTLGRMDTEHAKHPGKLYYASESLATGAWGNRTKTEENYYLGSFKWTAFDYIGEAGAGKSKLRSEGSSEPKGMAGMGFFLRDLWPVYNAFCGDFDLTGNKKPSSYYQDVVWGLSPVEVLVRRPAPEGMVEAVAPFGYPEEIKSWTWPGMQGKAMQVNVHTRSETVKLELNGKTIAEKKIPEGDISVSFNVPYQSGKLVARSYTNGKETGSSTLITTGKPAAIRLFTDHTSVRADKKDLSYIQVEVIDEKGNVVPYADNIEVRYDITGHAGIAAVGNGSPNDVSSFRQPRKKVYQGKGLVILQPDGKPGAAVLKAEANGLKSGSIEIEIK